VHPERLVRLNAAKRYSLIFSMVFNDCPRRIGMFSLSRNNRRWPCLVFYQRQGRAPELI
jgi:hypothetical protein